MQFIWTSKEVFVCDNMFQVTAFSVWLQSELNERGLSQSDLARLADINSGTISNLLGDLRRPGDEVCRAIARALGLPQYVVFMRAGLLTEAPREMTDRNYRIERLADRLMALPEAERDRLLEVAEKMTDIVETKTG